MLFHTPSETNSKLAIKNPAVLLLLLLVCFSVVLKLLLWKFSELNLSGDEALFWLCSKRADPAFYSKGPVIGWVIAAGTSLFGDSEFGVRIGGLVCGTLFSLLFILWATQLNKQQLNRQQLNRQSAVKTATLLLSSPFFFTLGIGTNTDPPAFLAWLLATFAAWNAIMGNSKWWIVAFSSFGLAILAKYSAVAGVVSLLGFLIFHDRKQFKDPYFLLGVLCFLACMALPVIWNAQHGWVNVAHNLGHLERKSSTSFNLWGPFEVVGVTLAMMGVLSGALLFNQARQAPRDRFFIFMMWMVLPLIVVCLLVSFVRPVYPNWPMPVGFLIALAAIRASSASQVWYRRALLINMGIILVASLMVLGFNFGIPWNVLATKKLYGWENVAHEANRVMPDAKFVIATRYDVVSLLSFYMKDHPIPISPAVGGRRMNEFDIWQNEKQMYGQDAVIVSQVETLPSEIVDSFRSVSGPLSRYDVVQGGVTLRTFWYFKGVEFVKVGWQVPRTF